MSNNTSVIMFIFVAALVVSCRTPKTTVASVQASDSTRAVLTDRVRAVEVHDTVMLHTADTVRITQRGDTVFIDRKQVVYQNKIIYKTDSIHILHTDTVRVAQNNSRTETIEMKEHRTGLKVSALFIVVVIGLVILLIVGVWLWVRRRFLR